MDGKNGEWNPWLLGDSLLGQLVFALDFIGSGTVRRTFALLGALAFDTLQLASAGETPRTLSTLDRTIL